MCVPPSPDKCPNRLGTRKVKFNNLPSGSNVVSFTKLEGRARDEVAMVTTTRQTKRPQLTMVTVPMPRPLPYLHVDVNPICTLPLRAWTAGNASSLRWTQEPRDAAATAASRGKRCGRSVTSSPAPVPETPVGSNRCQLLNHSFARCSFSLSANAFLSSPQSPRCCHQTGPQNM